MILNKCQPSFLKPSVSAWCCFSRKKPLNSQGDKVVPGSAYFGIAESRMFRRPSQYFGSLSTPLPSDRSARSERSEPFFGIADHHRLRGRHPRAAAGGVRGSSGLAPEACEAESGAREEEQWCKHVSAGLRDQEDDAHFCDLRESPVYLGGLVFKRRFLLHHSGHFPQPCV